MKLPRFRIAGYFVRHAHQNATFYPDVQHMYYEPGRTPHGLPYNPFKACIVPRPIGWISTTSAEGIDNLAPFSQFQMVSYDPPTLMFSANLNSRGQRKDTVRQRRGQRRIRLEHGDLGIARAGQPHLRGTGRID